MSLWVLRWGNSLALQIPPAVARQLGWREGATVQAEVTVDGGLNIRPTEWNREAFALELAEARNATPTSKPEMERLRSGARYLQRLSETGKRKIAGVRQRLRMSRKD